jgi:hypothetical protein
VGFAVSGAHEWMAADTTIRSPEDAVWAGHQIASIPGREETAVAWSLRGLELHAHTTEQAWPYGTPHWSHGRPAAARQNVSLRPLPSWRQLPTLTLDSIRSELRDGNAVIVTLRVVRSAWRTADGVIDAAPGRKTPGNHAVLAVASSEAAEQPERIVIKNSWGVNWGDSGYGVVTGRYLDHYGVRAHVVEPTTP